MCIGKGMVFEPFWSKIGQRLGPVWSEIGYGVLIEEANFFTIDLLIGLVFIVV